MKDALKLAFAVGILYWVVASFVFEWRHPKANRVACFRETFTALRFGTVEEYRK